MSENVIDVEESSGVTMTAEFSMNPMNLGNTNAAFPVPQPPPFGPLGLAPEPIPDAMAENQLLEALIYSPNAVVRQALKSSNFNPDEFIQAKGYDILDKMKTLAAYYTPLHLLVASTLYKQWRVIPKVNGEIVSSDHPRYARAVEIAQFVNYCCHNILDTQAGYDKQDFRNVIWYAIETGCHIGFSVQEIQYRRIGEGQYKGKLGFQRFIHRQPKTVRFNLDPRTDQIRSLNFQSSQGGYQNEINREKFLIYTFRPQKGLPHGLGLARTCYKHTLAIDTLIRLLGDALQRFGMGFLKATVTNASPEYVKAVQVLLNQVANGQPLVVTPDIVVELLSLAGGGLDPIQKAIILHKEEISAHILGQTLTTSTGGSSGSYALASVHQGTQKFFTGFPRRDIEVIMEHQPFTQLVIMNYGADDLDCVPGLDLGVYDHEEAKMVMDYVGTGVDKGVLNPNEVEIRNRAGFWPYDPNTPKESILPEKVQERITVMENPDGSKVTTKDAGSGGGN